MSQQTAIEIIAWHANGSIQSIELEAHQSVLVGKSGNCGLQLRGHDLSDIHCRIGFEDGSLWVQDWMSASGTKVNGERVTSKTQVGQGSVIEIGSYKIQLAKSKDKPSDDIPTSEYEHRSEDVVESAMMDREVEEPIRGEEEDLVDSPARGVSEMDRDSERTCDYVAKLGKELLGADVETSNSGGMDVDFFGGDEEVYDRETVELLQAEIEDLRAALAARDAESSFVESTEEVPPLLAEDETDSVNLRIQELIEEANQADERVLVLEEMLHAADDANRYEAEERKQLEAWVGDIEKRIGQREQEQAAEVDALRERLEAAELEYRKLQRELQQAASKGENVSRQYEETMDGLQHDKARLQDLLGDAQREIRQLQQQCENLSEQSDVELREERAKIAKEHAEMSRLKYQYAQKIKELEDGMPKSEEAQMDPRLQILQEHRQSLREMSEQRKRELEERPFAGRLKRLWNSLQ